MRTFCGLQTTNTGTCLEQTYPGPLCCRPVATPGPADDLESSHQQRSSLKLEANLKQTLATVEMQNHCRIASLSSECTDWMVFRLGPRGEGGVRTGIVACDAAFGSWLGVQTLQGRCANRHSPSTPVRFTELCSKYSISFRALVSISSVLRLRRSLEALPSPGPAGAARGGLLSFLTSREWRVLPSKHVPSGQGRNS